MRLLRLGFDIDGVLANFVHGFLGLVNQSCGTNYTEADWIEYGDPYPAFMTREQWDAGWAAVLTTPHFWAILEPYPVDFDKLASQIDGMEFHGCFFTRRRSTEALVGVNDAAWQTKAWLESQGLFTYTSLVCVEHGDRAALLKACEIDAYLDDWGAQFEKCLAAGIDCYLLDRPYNRHIDTSRRVHSIEEYVQRATARNAKHLSPAVQVDPSNLSAALVDDLSTKYKGQFHQVGQMPGILYVPQEPKADIVQVLETTPL